MFYINYVKRLIDISASFLAIIFLSPILLFTTICLLFTGEHYVFYFQERVGYKNKKFNIYKFVTMIKNSPNIGSGIYTKRNDPRVLFFGKFLRKTKINELPQLFNVLFGQMSIVGPRPLVDKTFHQYPKEIKNKIYNSKPGLTGIGSIIFRDEEKLLTNTKLPLEVYYRKFISPFKGNLEIWYQNNKSFYTDMMIIFITIWVIFNPNSNLPYKVFKDLPNMKL